MDNLIKLNLPDTFEELASELRDDFSKMAQFVIPIEDAEEKLAVIAKSIRSAGKVVLLLGLPGSGKSTFIQSLTWRKHLPIPKIIEIDVNELSVSPDKLLGELFVKLQSIAAEQKERKAPGALSTIVINYLENLADQKDEDIRALFRNINGLLRKNPLLIIWPLTEEHEAKNLLKHASAVSGTVFSEDPILEFNGPPFAEFPRIVKNMIATLNPGLSFDNFWINDDDLNVLLTQIKRENRFEKTIRHYIRNVRTEWKNRSGEIQQIIDRIPKPTEVWFMVCYPNAESVVSQFARKSPYAVDDAWDADYRRLSEYLAASQKAADWTPKRLQLAVRGIFRTKIMFLPTNAIVSCVASYGQQNGVNQKLLNSIWDLTHENWRKPVISRRFLETSPLVRQLKGETVSFGRRSGQSSQSIKRAEEAFMEISTYDSTAKRVAADPPQSGKSLI